MTCTIPRPAPQILFDRIANQFSANVLGGGAIIPESAEWGVVSNDYLATETFYSIADQQWKERDPRTACCDNLVAMAADRGVYPNAAEFARGFVTITGTAGAALPPNMQFLFGHNYYRADITSILPTVMPASGSVVIRVVATEPGAVGNDIGTSGTSGRMVTSLININQVVTSCGTSFCNGRDAEDCESFRTRYLDRLAYKPVSDLSWAVDILRAYPCLTRICLRNCGCCEQMHELQLYAFFDGTFPYGIAPQNVLDDLQLWFFGTPQGVGAGKAPFGVRGAFYVQTAAAVNVTIAGLDCTTSTQTELIKVRLAALFAGLCPGATLRQKAFNLVVGQVVGPDIDFDVRLEIATGAVGITVNDCGDIVTECDVLPVLGSISIPSAVC